MFKDFDKSILPNLNIMKYDAFIGIDVSKEKLDFVVISNGVMLFHMVVTNNEKGIKQFFKCLDDQLNTDSCCLFCLEHTGIYCFPFLSFSVHKNLSVWLEAATKINAFHGAFRDKNDKVDALRIAEYAAAKSQIAHLWEPERKIIQRLKSMITLRDRLIKAKNSLAVACKEEEFYTDKQWHKEHQERVKPILDQITKQTRDIERTIKEAIDQDDQLSQLYQLASSVKGVGLIVAVNIIIVSNEFKSIREPKKMACHCGVVPFNQQSGKSLKTRSRVSKKANKKVKSLLNLAARSAVASKGEMQEYYFRKVAEGKNKMSVLNAIRNKIIHRVFACVRDGRKYDNNYIHKLA